MKPEIRVTELAQGLNCSKWFYYNNSNLEIENVSSNALDVGTAGHSFLYTYYTTKNVNWWMYLDDTISENDNELLRGILEHYDSIYEYRKELEIEAIREERYHADFGDFSLTGQFDCLYKQKIVDYKFVSKMYNEMYYALSYQRFLYPFILWKATGQKIKIFNFRLIRKSVPSIPELLRGGKISVKKIDTTYDVFAKTILDYGKSLFDYKSTLDYYKKRGNTFFRDYVFPVPSYIYTEAYTDKIYRICMDLLETEGIRNPSIYCQEQCKFASLCLRHAEIGK